MSLRFLVAYIVAQFPLHFAPAADTPVPDEVPANIRAVFEELAIKPTVKLIGKVPAEFQPDDVTTEAILKDPQKYAVRSAVLKAAVAVRRVREAPRLTELADPVTRETKRELIVEQEQLALAILELSEIREELQTATGEKSKRWLAHRDYLLAAVQMHLARTEEYNRLLGSVRTDELPPLDAAKQQNGWRLIEVERMTSLKIVRDGDRAARKRFEQIRNDYPDTLWAKLAEQDLASRSGLKWEPVPLARRR